MQEQHDKGDLEGISYFIRHYSVHVFTARETARLWGILGRAIFKYEPKDPPALRYLIEHRRDVLLDLIMTGARGSILNSMCAIRNVQNDSVQSAQADVLERFDSVIKLLEKKNA